MHTNRLYMTIALLCSILLACNLGCGKKIIIPEYETAQEQYIFAMKVKTSTMKGFDEKTRKKQLKRMESAFYMVINDFPDDNKFTPAAFISLGNTYLDYKEWAKAMRIFDEAIQKYPGQEDIQLWGHYGLGMSYDRLGKYEEARNMFKICIDKFGDDSRSAYQDVVKKAQARYNRIREQ